MKVSKIVDKIYLILLVVMCACSGAKDGDNFSYDLIPVKVDEKWGYIDINGKYIINPQFKEACLFADGLAVVQAMDGKFGYIGTDGRYVIQPIYKDVTNFSEGLAFVTAENSYPMCIDKDGKEKFRLDDVSLVSSFQDGLAIVEAHGKSGLIDKNGKTIVNPQYTMIFPFEDGLAACCVLSESEIGGKWGYLDKDGKVAINMQFRGASSFSGGLAAVGVGEKYGYINKKGAIVINPQFEFGMDFCEGLAAIQQGDKWGYIDKNGKIVINPQFDRAFGFKNGLARVEAEKDKWGYINKEGKYVINPQFEGASDFYGGKFAVVINGGKIGLINKEGKYTANPQYDKAFAYNRGNTFYYGSQHNNTKSFYFDGKDFCESFFMQSGGDEFRGLTKESTLRDVVTQSPLKEYLKPSSIFSIKLDFVTYEPGDVKVVNTTYSFIGRIYEEAEYIGDEGSYNGDVALRRMTYQFRFEEGGKSEKKGKVLAKAIVNKIKKLYNATEEDPNGTERDLMIRQVDSMVFNTSNNDGNYIFLYTPTKRFSISYNDDALDLSVSLSR